MGGAVAGAAPHLRHAAGGPLNGGPHGLAMTQSQRHKERRRGIWITVVVLVLLVLGFYIGTFVSNM